MGQLPEHLHSISGSLVTPLAGASSHPRLFSVSWILTNKGNLVTTPAPAARTAANPDLKGLSPWEIFQAVVDALTTDRVKAGKDPVYVILNQHLLSAGWCCSDADNNGFWYNDSWPSSVFIRCWQAVADRFAANPYVGYDIHNEPRKATIGGTVRTPSWGTGTSTDFRQMYETMTTLIRQRDPDCLVFCEGLSYAGDLSGWRADPVRRANVVASMHDYEWFHPAGQPQGAYQAQMDAKGGYLVTSGTAPLWIGEFGANTDVPLAAMRSGWLPQFIAYAAKRGLHWCWWELNATTVLGTEPTTGKVKAQPGARESFGLLSGQDWQGTQGEALKMLAPVMAAG